MRSIFLAVVRLYLVVVVLAGASAGAGRTVLCLESSGRVVLETGQGRCADRVPSANGDIAGADVATLPDGCGDCVDLPVGTNVLSAGRHGIPSSISLPLVAFPAGQSPIDGHSWDADSRVDAARVLGSRPGFKPSRTTILRN